MFDLPSGTVTFAFTDIEDSTALLLARDFTATRRRPAARPRGVFRRGVEIDTQGDAFFFAFPRARDAAAARGRAHARFDWLHGAAVRVRIGLHTASPTWATRATLGLDVVRAARICTAARGSGAADATRAPRLRASGRRPGYPRGEPAEGHRRARADFELEIEGAPVRRGSGGGGGSSRAGAGPGDVG